MSVVSAPEKIDMWGVRKPDNLSKLWEPVLLRKGDILKQY